MLWNVDELRFVSVTSGAKVAILVVQARSHVG